LLNKASGSILAWFNVEEATHADVHPCWSQFSIH
jgi:hypothetical protein